MNSRRVIQAWDSFDGHMYRNFYWLAVKLAGLMLAVGFIAGRQL